MSRKDTTQSRLVLAEQCRRVELRPRYERLADVATDLHLIGNDGSNERYHDGSDYRDRAERGYRAELAVAQYYGLPPEIDYRPPGVGDLGRDFWARYSSNGSKETIRIDVKETSVDPPKLYLTRKRSWSEKYHLPDYYILTSLSLTDDNSVHIIGWASADHVMNGEKKTVYNNPVWVRPASELNTSPRRSDLNQIDRSEQLVRDAAIRNNIGQDDIAPWIIDNTEKTDD